MLYSDFSKCAIEIRWISLSIRGSGWFGCALGWSPSDFDRFGLWTCWVGRDMGSNNVRYILYQMHLDLVMVMVVFHLFPPFRTKGLSSYG